MLFEKKKSPNWETCAAFQSYQVFFAVIIKSPHVRTQSADHVLTLELNIAGSGNFPRAFTHAARFTQCCAGRQFLKSHPKTHKPGQLYTCFMEDLT